MNLLTNVLKGLLSETGETPTDSANPGSKHVLNVGGNDKDIPLPNQYDDWKQSLLDIDPKGNPDIVCDARNLTTLPANSYDAIYCSHNLEHYYRHEVPAVLGGFLHVLKDNGFAHIRVPDIGALTRAMVENKLDLDDVLYQMPIGPITVMDVIYGYGPEIEQSGQDFFAHKTGFTASLLRKTLLNCGFKHAYLATLEPTPGEFEIAAIAFKNVISDQVRTMFGLSDRPA